MRIELSGLGKRFNREWIFRRVDMVFSAGNGYAITGPNGSGKSTLLQVISGATMATEGKVDYIHPNGAIPPEAIYRQVAIAAPYLELIEEMTATECLSFHAQFKPLTSAIPAILAIVGLEKAAHRQIRYFSSGMKQRLKLAQAFFSGSPVLLLDEPCTNLDAQGIQLYRELIATHTPGKILIVSSNDPQEYDCCSTIVQMEAWKEGK